ncbi:hypothetical protein BS47DRAFT_1486569 [Hydnum rufescens UP504]|uniref:FAD dependent oxidoreductase domain-containing protein n=1 Tax=Hydnum rufescens UP504 TaxID=1448309 RepID=A0A9P6AW77_9AGAM|nr:hypothetical protein BS47DRAFT_1486569 [Hydnum rufescens UP504]
MSLGIFPTSEVLFRGGIVGTSIAYYLSRHPNVLGDTSVYVLESSYIAAGASGKAGGFLALNWHGPTTSSLAALSFKLHEELATEHDGEKKWGYRKLVTLGIDSDPNSNDGVETVPHAEWIADVVGSVEPLGDETTTAQVHPFLMTNALISAAQDSGVNVTIAKAETIVRNEETKEITGVTAVTRSGEILTIPATDVVFAAGPWTGTITTQMLGEKAAGGAANIIPSNRSTSIVVSPPESRELTPHALFCTLVLPDGSHGQPEFYPRPDRTLYVCSAGMSDQTPLPEYAEDVVHSEEGVRRLKERLRIVVRKEWIGDVLESDNFIRQACYRPDSSKTHLPVIGKIGDGLWVASGHEVWGILLGPGTGKVMSELLLEGKEKSANISSLRP